MNAKRTLAATMSAIALAAGLGLPATASADRGWDEHRYERPDGWGHHKHWKHRHDGPRYYTPPPVVYYMPPPPPPRPVVVYPAPAYPWSGWDARIVFRGGGIW